ncbi:MAG TPA: hypothetical protein VME45_10665 [Stellaceae bacterium]|nr:hypothetical protein [Stellaceae bacterium]
MRQYGALPRAFLLLGVLGLATATETMSARAQGYYVCPDGYYYLDNYGCAPLAYYENPSILVPGFGFFYGGGWSGRGGYRSGGGYHGGGGFHGGGSSHGGGRR